VGEHAPGQLDQDDGRLPTARRSGQHHVGIRRGDGLEHNTLLGRERRERVGHLLALGRATHAVPDPLCQRGSVSRQPMDRQLTATALADQQPLARHEQALSFRGMPRDHQ
jgi:hypothetical protein